MASDWDWMNGVLGTGNPALAAQVPEWMRAAGPAGSGNDFGTGNWQLPNVPNLQATYYKDFLRGLLGQGLQNALQNPWGEGRKAPFDVWNNASWMDDKNRGAMKSWLENLGFPLAQMQQNQQKQAFDQWQAIQNMNTQNAMNQFNMGQQNWTNQFQKWVADQQQNQFLKQLGLDTDVAKWRFGAGGLEERALENERYGIDQTTARNTATLANNLDVQALINSGALGQIGARGTEDRLTQQLLGQQQMEQLKKQLGSQELQSRYQAFGRAQAPNARWTGNW